MREPRLRMIRVFGRRTAGYWGVTVDAGRFLLHHRDGRWEIEVAEARRPGVQQMLISHGLRWTAFPTRRAALQALTVMLHAEGLLDD